MAKKDRSIYELVDTKKGSCVIQSTKSDCETLKGALLATQPERKDNLIVRKV